MKENGCKICEKEGTWIIIIWLIYYTNTVHKYDLLLHKYINNTI